MQGVESVRADLRHKLAVEEFVVDKSGVRAVEVVGESFLADEPTIFGGVDVGYVRRELEWYLSQSLNVNDIPGKVPEIWKQVATPDGRVNSNYGYLAFSSSNGDQFTNVVKELLRNPWSRRAVMIYTRPSMHSEYDRDGMSDFVCTNAVQYLYRDGRLSAVVQMRSNDAVLGYKNDFFWQSWLLDQLVDQLNRAGAAFPIPVRLERGDIIWNAGSLHVYERHFKLMGVDAKWL